MFILSHVFSFRMVLQRGKSNPVWGYAKPGTEIEVALSDLEKEIFRGTCVAGASDPALSDMDKEKLGECDGYFEVMLPPMEAGTGYIIKVKDEDQNIYLGDVAFGDVFVCGGQSNMELPISRTFERYEKEAYEIVEPDIRLLRVPERYNFHGTNEMIEPADWYYAKAPELFEFGAAAFFTALELYKREGVPIGIINTAIGGTPIKSWVSEQTMRKLGLHIEEFEKCQDDEWVKSVIEKDAADDVNWREEAFKAYDEDYSSLPSGTLTVPGYFEGTELDGKIMSICVTKEVELPAGWEEKPVKLYLGAIVDADMVYVNGTLVGETGYLYPPRIYRVPAGVFKAGTNKIEIRMLVFRGQGGFVPGMEYKLLRSDGEEVSLRGTWNYQIIKDMEFLPDMTFFSYKATGVYNGMIYPLRRQKCSGFFFYQGESNIEEYSTYKEEFTAMTEDWRELWGDDTLPMIFVQISSFRYSRDKGGDKRAIFADEQRKCTEIPYTAMAQSYDIGDPNDLHPTNKKELGRRLALAAEDLVYGKEKYSPGPEKVSSVWKETEVEFTFSEKLILSHGIGMGEFLNRYEKRDETNIVGFRYVSNGEYFEAAAHFTGECTVAVELPAGVEIDAVCYAWSESATEANLFSEDRLPVVPFYEGRE